MSLVLYDTMTRTKQPFRPLDPTNVRMYVCGPTVYGEAHIGNARPVIVFDVLFRLLRHLYGETHVTYVRNITDVDDKINARAKERGIPIRQLTEETARVYQQDARALGCLDPTHEPRVTDHIAEIVDMIGRLIRAEAAYVAEGHVLYSVESKADYGKLARRALDEMIAGARVDVAPYKKNPMDFVLWKPSDAETPGWDSPWGRGRPGWHIECSAMAKKYLTETFDIHGGGIDLVFPHHENEIAQSESAHGGKPVASIWMHNGFLQVEGEKMSKSLGNFVTISDVLNEWPGNPYWGDVVRFNMLRTHYRQPINWTKAGLSESLVAITTFCQAVRGASLQGARVSVEFLDALSDDLNTPAAIAVLHRLAKRATSTNGSDEPASAADELVGSLSLLGFQASLAHVKQTSGVREDIEAAWRAVEAKQRGIDSGRVEQLIESRAAARKAKNWAEADRLRAELTAMGVAIEDGPSGTTWKVAP